MNAEPQIKSSLKENIVSLPYTSAYSFRYYSDHGWISDGHNDKYVKQLKNGINPKLVKENQSIYISTDLIDRFFEEIAPQIDVPYKLISGRTDRGVDDELSRKITPNLIHWYTHNNMSHHPKVTTIPIGLQNLHWRVDNHPQSDVRNIIQVANEDIDVDKDILVSFRIETNARDRQPCFDYFNQLGDFVTLRQNFEEWRADYDFILDYFRTVRRHKFVVCPFGNAYDCHRNWEVFALGSIPIIKRHRSMEEFYDMPAWFVDDWSEVDLESIQNKYTEMRDLWDTYNHEKIYFEYWRKRIFE